MDIDQQRMYQKQIILPEVEKTGQASLLRAKVLCVGAGGLGSPALYYLAAAGVGTLGIIDGDAVDITNLQRQILYTYADQNRLKSDAACERIQMQNPHIKCVSYPFELTVTNAREIISQYDLVIDGTDNFSTKFLINDTCAALERPWIYGAVNRWEGQVAAFFSKKGSCYRCLYKTAPLHPVTNCAENGVIGAAAGIIGSWQALLAIQILLPKVQNRWGYLQIIDTLSLQQLTIQIEKSPQCPTCNSLPSEIELISNPVSITKIQLKYYLENADNYLLVDVRTVEEWTRGHIPQAHHWPLSQFENGILPEKFISEARESGTTLLLYCQSGVRSQKAADCLALRGCMNIAQLRGGYSAWSAAR